MATVKVTSLDRADRVSCPGPDGKRWRFRIGETVENVPEEVVKTLRSMRGVELETNDNASEEPAAGSDYVGGSI